MVLSLSQIITFLEGDRCNYNFDLLTVESSEYNTIRPNVSRKIGVGGEMPSLTDIGLQAQPHSSMSHTE